MIAPPVSVWRLGRHELNLQLKDWKIGDKTLPAALLLAVGTGIGWVLAARLDLSAPRGEALAPFITLGVLFAATLFLAQALLHGTRTLFAPGDLALLLSAPVPPRRIVAAKLLGIASGIVAVFGPAMLPILLPVAIMHDWRWLGAVPMLFILAVGAAVAALALLVAIARLAGSRRAQTAGNVLAACFGGLFFLFTQVMAPAVAGLAALEADHPLLAPARGVHGDPIILLAGLVAVAALTFGGLRFIEPQIRTLVSEASAPRAIPSGRALLPNQGLIGSIVVKELRLLSREPELLFQILLRVMYLIPLLWIIIRGRDEDLLLMSAGIAFIAGHLCSSIAWLTVSGEDVPDLLATAPVPTRTLQFAKLSAALIPSLVLLALACGVFAFWSVAASATSFVTGTVVALATGGLELKLARPMPRAAFGKGKESNFFRSVPLLLVSLACAAIGTWLGSLFWVPSAD